MKHSGREAGGGPGENSGNWDLFTPAALGFFVVPLADQPGSHVLGPVEWPADDGIPRLWRMAELLQDAAAEHAALLGSGIERLREHNLAWVLTRLQMATVSLPRPGQSVRVATRPLGGGRLVAGRAFEVLAGERLLARALSAWVVMDLSTRRPVHLPEDLLSRVAEMLGPEARSFDRRTAFPAPPQGPPQGPDKASTSRLTVTSSACDLDVNGHVNNARQLAWAEQAGGLTLGPSQRMAAADVVFLEEVRAGQELEVRGAAREGSGESVLLDQELARVEDGGAAARLASRWRLVEPA